MKEEILRNALMVKATVHSFPFMTSDKDHEAEIAEKYRANPEALKLGKQLISNENANRLLSTVRKIVPIMRKYSTPLLDGGWRLVSVKPDSKGESNFDRLKTAMSEVKLDLDEVKREFETNYESYITQAETDLGDTFKRSDYPLIEMLMGRFGFDFKIEPVPSSKHLIVDLSSDSLNEIKKKMDEEHQEALQAAQKEVWEKIVSALKRIHERMTAEKITGKNGKERNPRLCNSIFDNTRELIELLPGLNILGDPKMEEIRRELEDKFASFVTKEIKNDEDTKKKIAKDAEKMLDILKDLV